MDDDDLASLILRKLSLLLTLTLLPGSSLDVDAVDGSGPLSQLLATASIAIRSSVGRSHSKNIAISYMDNGSDAMSGRLS